VDSGVAIGFYDSLPETSSSEDKPRWYPERDLKKKRLSPSPPMSPFG